MDRLLLFTKCLAHCLELGLLCVVEVELGHDLGMTFAMLAPFVFGKGGGRPHAQEAEGDCSGGKEAIGFGRFVHLGVSNMIDAR